MTARTSADGVITTDRQGVVTWLSRTATLLTGWSPDDAVGAHISEIVVQAAGPTGGASSAGPVDLLQDRVRHGAAQEETAGDFTLITRRGATRRAGGLVSPIRDASGEMVGAALTFWEAEPPSGLGQTPTRTDPAVRDRVLEILVNAPYDRMTYEVLAVLLDATDSRHGVFAYVEDDGTVVACSRQRDENGLVAELFAQGAGPDTVRFPPESWGDSLWATAIREGRTQVVAAGDDRRPGGGPLIVPTMVVPILYRQTAIGYLQMSDRPNGYGPEEIALCEAIGLQVAPVLESRLVQARREVAQRRAELALRQSEIQHRTFLDASADLAFIKDADFRYVMVNAGYARLFGRTVDDLIGREDAEIMPAEAARACRNTDAFALSEGRLVINDEILRGRIYETRKFPVPLGQTTGVGGVIRDVTEQTMARQELHRNETRLRSLVRILQHPADTVEAFLDFALTEALALTESAVGCVHFYDEVTGQLSLSTWSGPAQGSAAVAYHRRIDDLAATGLWGDAVREGRPVIVNGPAAPHPPGELVARAGQRGPSSFLAVPVISQKRIVAVVSVADKASDYTDSDVLQLTLLMDTVWKVIDRRRAEEALQQEKDNLASVLAAVPVATLVFDGDEQLVLANPAAERMFGAPRTARMIGRRCGDLLVCANRRQGEQGCGSGTSCASCPLSRALRAVLHGEPDGARTGHQGETRICQEGGASMWISYRVSAVTLDGERRAVMALDDVTERRAAQEALASERRLLRTVVDNLPDAIYAKDAGGRKTLANWADVRNMGLATEAESLGKTDAEIFPRWVSDRLLAQEHRVLEKGEPIIDREELLALGDGSQRWISTSKFPLRDEQGRIVGLVGTGRDITERKRAEAERRELLAQVETQARQVRQIIETVPQGVLLLGKQGRVLMTNPVADADLARLARGHGNQLTHLGDRPLDALLTSPPHGFWHEVHADGRVYEVVARPVADLTSDESWVMVINDATETRQVRDQLQRQERLAAVGQLAAGIAHDFNNIMAVIVLHAQLVSNGLSLSPRDRERLGTINDQARHATRLIEQILDFSRRSVLARQPLDLYPLLNEQVKLLRRTLPEHIKVELAAERSATDEGFLVDADPTRIQQLVMNLAINARDAMSEGGLLELRLSRLALEADDATHPVRLPAGEWVVLAVRDTGTGIASEVLDHMFEPFYTTKPAGQGSGLGLAQVHGIVGQHGGQIDVQTELGVGTTFTIFLPALSRACAEEGGDGTDARPVGRGEVILLVEDSIPLREALDEMLTDWGYRVLGAENGLEALALLDRGCDAIDLVLTDVVMPRMGGPALVRVLRERGEALPVIMMSGHPHHVDLEALRADGVVAWLQKPPDLDMLAATIAEALV